MTLRREFLASGVAGTGVATAGCLGFFSDDGPQFASLPAAPTGVALETTGFPKSSVELKPLSQIIGVDEVEPNVQATYWAGRYTTDLAARGSSTESVQFTILSAPGTDMLGRDQPLAQMDTQQLLESCILELEEITTVEQQGTYSLDILGEERTVTVVRLVERVVEGVDQEFVATLVNFTHEGDYLLAAGWHPPDVKQSISYERLFESVEHPIEAPSDAKVGQNGESESGVLVIEEAVEGRVTATSPVHVKSGVTIAGAVESGANVELEPKARIEGGIETDGEAVVGANGTIEGTVDAERDVFVGSNSRIAGHVQSDRDVHLGSNVEIEGGEDSGNITASGDVVIGADSRIAGSIEVYGAVDIADSAEIDGEVDQKGA